ncbi:MAG: tyrosine-protein phosphatase [Anaerolineales bacterium]|nr:tyrosine-protein phosphatase [Anaerolineales bacterium]
MVNERVLQWDGCINVRDLGGLRTGDGRTTRWGAVVRSDTPARLTAAGWSPLYYKFALLRWPERHAALVSAIARAHPGGVLS